MVYSSYKYIIGEKRRAIRSFFLALHDMKLLENNNIRLRALEPSDLALLYKWENNSSLWEFGSTLSPYSKSTLEEYIRDSRLDIYTVRQLRLMIELKHEDNATVGTIDLYDFDPHHNRAGIGILIDPAYQKRGFATEALGLMERYAFSFLLMHQLYAYVPNANTASLSLFAKAGYQPAGVLKKWLVVTGGRREDVAVLQKFAG